MYLHFTLSRILLNCLVYTKKFTREARLFAPPPWPNFATLIVPNIQLSKKIEREGLKNEFGTNFLFSFKYIFGIFHPYEFRLTALQSAKSLSKFSFSIVWKKENI